MERLDTATIRALAVAHQVDPRSIRREIREPGCVKGMAGHRARAALRESGHGPPPIGARDNAVADTAPPASTKPTGDAHVQP